MSGEFVTVARAKQLLRRQIAAHGSTTGWGRCHRLDPAIVTAFLREGRSVPPSICIALNILAPTKVNDLVLSRMREAKQRLEQRSAAP